MGHFEGFIGINFWTALFVLLNTLTVFFVARKFLFNPIQKIITDRQNEIDGMYADADKAVADANEMAAEYKNKLADAHAASDRLIKEAVVRGQKKEAEIVNQANAKATAILNKAAAEVDMEKKKAESEIRKQIADVSTALTEQMLKREVKAEDHRNLIASFIMEMGDAE